MVSQEDLFGKSGDEIQRDVEQASGSGHIDRLCGQVTGLRSSSSGLVVIALDNGQVWRQIDAPKLRIAEGDNVLIRRASLGSYMMQKVGSKRSMQVKRTS